MGARGLCSLSGRKIDSESAWGIRNLHIGCWVSGRVLSWSLIDFLRPEQGWQCERQMVPLGVALTSPGSSQHINKQTGPSQRGLGSGSYQPGRRAGEYSEDIAEWGTGSEVAFGSGGRGGAF